MYSKKQARLRHTLAFQLTVRSSAIFVVLSLAAFLVSYVLISSVIRGRTDQELLNEVKEFSVVLNSEGIEGVTHAIGLEAESEGVDKMFFRLMSAQGEELASSNMSTWRDIDISKSALASLANGASDRFFETLASKDHPRGVRILYGNLGAGNTVQLGRSLEDEEQFREVFQRVFASIMVFFIVFAVPIAWFTAKRALLGIEEVTQAALDISSGALERRVVVKRRSEEIDRLANTFNSMVERIHALVTGMREMTDNMAHDLRSPIARMRGSAEMILCTGKSIGDFEAFGAAVVEECDRLLEMVNTMLDISEAEAGAYKLRMEKIELTRVVGDACDLFQPVAEDKGIRIVFEGTDDFWVRGDMQKLQRMVANLLDNALKYTLSGGIITISVSCHGEQVSISFGDTGSGISNEDLPHIFERFYRCDRSRSQAGIGLGLSLAAAISRAHGGNITVMSELGKGSTFTVSLPELPLSH